VNGSRSRYRAASDDRQPRPASRPMNREFKSAGGPRLGASSMTNGFYPSTDEPWGSCVDGPRGARDLLTWERGGRVHSCVRPVDAVFMTAGHDEVRGSGPNQVIALRGARAHSGFSRSPGRPVRHHAIVTPARLFNRQSVSHSFTPAVPLQAGGSSRTW